MRLAPAMKKGLSEACVFPLLAAAAFVRCYNCLFSLRLGQDDITGITVFHASGAGFLESLRWAFTQGGFSFSPTMHLTMRLPHLLGWSAPQGFRMLAIMLLALNAWMVYLIAARLVKDKRWALAGALFYILLPIHNENESALGIPMYLTDLFIMMGFHLHLDGLEKKTNWRRIALTCALYLLAMLTKETGVLLPAFTLAWDLIDPLDKKAKVLGRRARCEYSALFAIFGFYAVFRLTMPSGPVSIVFSSVLDHFADLFNWYFMAFWIVLLYRHHSLRIRVHAFCAAWILIGVSVLLLLPSRYILSGRYLFLSHIGLTFFMAVALDAIEESRSIFWCAPAVLIILFSLRMAGGGPFGCPDRRMQLINIRERLGSCAPLPQGRKSSKTDCVSAALSLPLAKTADPAAYDELEHLLRRILPARDRETMMRFFGDASLDGDSPRWRYFSRIWPELSGENGSIEDLRPFLEAEEREPNIVK